jgi:NADP-dependent 3-hydroxy acid dehydrogenase YdfG
LGGQGARDERCLQVAVVVAVALTADLTDVGAAADAAGRLDRLDILVNNAGVILTGDSVAAPLSERERMVDVNVRFSVVEPGLTQTELVGHQQSAVQERMTARFADVEQLQPDDIAEAVQYIVTSPRRRAVAEIVIRPTGQV